MIVVIPTDGNEKCSARSRGSDAIVARRAAAAGAWDGTPQEPCEPCFEFGGCRVQSSERSPPYPPHAGEEAARWDRAKSRVEQRLMQGDFGDASALFASIPVRLNGWPTGMHAYEWHACQRT